MNEYQKEILDLLKKQSAKIDLLENKLSTIKDVFNIDDLCLYTGLAKSYVYKLTSKRLIPHSNPRGKCLFFSKTVIDQWLLLKPVKTIDQIQNEISNI